MCIGRIFSIEEFAIHDGPGIRTTIFLKGCPLRCTWCHNPEGILPEPQYMDKRTGRVLCGYEISSSELAGMMLRNKSFFEMNEGGITLSGGEPLYQPEFVIDLLKKVKPIHTAIETSGYASSKVFKEIIEVVDLVLFDIKHTDPEVHKKYTGVDNKIILKNFSYLKRTGKKFIVRIPLIPTVNDTEENMKNILSIIKGTKSLIRVELLPYHKTAGAKYEMIGEKYNPLFNTEISPKVYDVFNKNNIKMELL
jgi:pyruvate formate lyase activating enzyme